MKAWPYTRWRRASAPTAVLLLLAAGCLATERPERPAPAVAELGPTADAPGVTGRADWLDLAAGPGRTAGAVRGGSGVCSFEWVCGDRTTGFRGVQLTANGPPLDLRFRVPRTAAALTLELREFRTASDGRMAYRVDASGRPLHLRNRQYAGPGPSTAFVDIPGDRVGADGVLDVRLTNLCDNPVCFAEALLYDDLDGYARGQGLVEPLYIGPIIDPVLERPDDLRRLRALLPDTAEVKPLVSLCTLAVAAWPPETVAAKLDRLLAAARDLGVKAEVQAITWWGGTPGGCDADGGRWHDVTYQQVTYRPGTHEFGLSIPNMWSNTPWLTVAHPRLNAFKADCLARFGRLLYDRWQADPVGFPIVSVVVDNEPTYWAAGNPGATADQQADFNPAMVAAARAQGVELDPRDGLGADERGFLRRALLAYNRTMNAGLRRGLGDGALAERVFTHTFMNPVGGLFEDLGQATASGVLRTARLGGEWEASPKLVPVLEQHRELGLPAGINRECGDGDPVDYDLMFAYAMGCSHLTLFNCPERNLERLRPALAAGWAEVKPEPWRRVLWHTDRFRRGPAGLADWFAETRGVRVEPWPGEVFGIVGEKTGVSAFATLHLRAADLTGRPGFGPLILRYQARAFVFRQDNPDGYLAIRAGTARHDLREVERMCNGRGRPCVDLSALVRGAADLWLEFEFHPLGLPGWVELFDVALETPWEEEDLLFTNRSYRADRLRCESAVVGWRADARWALTRAAEVAAAQPPAAAVHGELRSAQALYRGGAYRRACEAARLLVERRAAPPAEPVPAPPPPERTDAGELAGADRQAVHADLYAEGYRRSVPLAATAQIVLEENGVRRPLADPADLRHGDDVTLEVRGGQAVSVLARRGTATGSVSAVTPMTPFAMPTVAVAGEPARPLAGNAVVATGQAFPGWSVGYRPVAEGQTVTVRWNAHTNRIVDLRVP